MRKQKVKREELKGKVSKKNNGITLIALVITVIVLLILAGVTIATLTGENGILTRASQASEQTEIAEEKEQLSLAYTGVLADKNGKGDVTAEELQNELHRNGRTDAQASGENPITVTYESGREYTVDANGNITGPTVSNITATMTIEGEKVETPPLPSSDFTHTEGTVDTGYVIQDTSGNEFVWVPVDKNQKIQINVSSKENIESISLTDPYGDEITLPDTDSLGTSYNNTEIDPTINGPYVLKINTASEEKIVTLGVHSLYEIDTMADWSFTEENAEAKGASSLEEFLMGYTLEEAYGVYGADYKKYSEPEADYTDTVTSVNENGGFYIGRYEASYENGKVVSKVSTVANTGATLENGKLWNNISQTDALSNAKNMYTSSEFTSSLLTGAAWDRTLGWLYETGAVSWQEILIDSSSWGNYSDDSFSNTTSLINTGSMPKTEKNNIYDLAGNLWEWTTEAVGTDGRVSRGRLLQHQWL